jgi:hypothetical protein
MPRSSAAGYFTQPPLPGIYLCILVFIFILLILFGTGAISIIAQRYYYPWRRRDHKFLHPKIGIINVKGSDLESEEIYSCTDIIPEGWKEEIERQSQEDGVSINVILIDVRRSFDSYVAILNPYGGAHPERDVKNNETLNKIFDYVNKGGLFVNVADIPGYWAYNLLLKRRLDATTPIYGVDKAPNGQISITRIRPFELTPFMEKLGLRVLNIENSPLTNWKVEFEDRFKRIAGHVDEIKVDRATVVERNVKPIIKPKVDGETALTPFFLGAYGNGEFLISQIFFDNKTRPQNNKMKELVAKVVIELIREKNK